MPMAVPPARVLTPTPVVADGSVRLRTGARADARLLPAAISRRLQLLLSGRGRRRLPAVARLLTVIAADGRALEEPGSQVSEARSSPCERVCVRAVSVTSWRSPARERPFEIDARPRPS